MLVNLIPMMPRLLLYFTASSRSKLARVGSQVGSKWFFFHSSCSASVFWPKLKLSQLPPLSSPTWRVVRYSIRSYSTFIWITIDMDTRFLLSGSSRLNFIVLVNVRAQDPLTQRVIQNMKGESVDNTVYPFLFLWARGHACDGRPSPYFKEDASY